MLTFHRIGVFMLIICFAASASLRSAHAVTPYPNANTAPDATSRIEAENFDSDGEGKSFHDTSVGNAGGSYRSTNVDIQATTDTGGGYNVGWIEAGEWLAYTVSFASAGSHDFEMRVAAPLTGRTYYLKIQALGASTPIINQGPYTLPITSGWQNWISVMVKGLNIPATGKYVVTIYTPSGGFNVNYFKFSKQTSSGGASGVLLNVAAPGAGWSLNSRLLTQDVAAYCFPMVNGDGVKVAVVDNGAFIAHSAFPSPDRSFIRGLDFVYGQTTSPGSDIRELGAHGTMSLAMAVQNYARYNNEYFMGMAPKADFIVVRATGDNISAYWPTNYAYKWLNDNYAAIGSPKVITASISLLSAPSSGHIQGIQGLYNKGVFMTVAAGNNFSSTPATSIAMSTFATDPQLAPYTVAVGAAATNSGAPVLDNITARSKPDELDILGPGQNVITPILTNTTGYWKSPDNATSMATPHVAGAAALLYQINPAFTPAQVLSILKDSGRAVYDNLTGRTYKFIQIAPAIQLGYKRAGKAIPHYRTDAVCQPYYN